MTAKRKNTKVQGAVKMADFQQWSNMVNKLNRRHSPRGRVTDATVAAFTNE